MTPVYSSKCAAELQLVAAGELLFLDLATVDERAVRAVQIAKEERFAAFAELGVLARHFGIVELDGVRRATAERHRSAVESEASTLIATLNHKQ